ncbi:putative Methylase involved in ubiquinone/menaquinone biosynthesis [Mesorhizobium metallidurans STM 2683]|uniref:Putative Methylase involved in ubiquinone/menaquinone biosynthesis n=1 Tax=Mesorhizobium metallidurans STM 2683 TaxID=1297569 RepID=M5EFL4_9HYPH|nr:class I SAM-dependent methyltransferase [Mesorhizobium metallidurans]CCV03080.1 putative Methylase involved in ubiquinone/menaquinone biosynthesis [Mesorhizobium metallidurans STM 2683]
MNQLSLKPTAAAPNWSIYTGAAGHYQATRPDYPSACPEWILEELPPSAETRLAVDVGCGTGIFTRRIADAFDKADRILGIEPNDDMRAQAMLASETPSNITYIPGSSEALPVDANSAILVTAASAAHWFDLPKFYSEAARVLRSDGAVAIVQNKRRWWDSPFLDAYEQFHERFVPGYRRGTFPDRFGGFAAETFVNDLAKHDQFRGVRQSSWDWNRSLSKAEFKTLSLSTSHTRRALAGNGESVVMKALDDLLDLFSGTEGHVDVPYVTEVTMAKRLPLRT